MGQLSTDLQGMRKLVMDLKTKIAEKDNKMNDLQAVVDSRELKISVQDKENIEKDKDIV